MNVNTSIGNVATFSKGSGLAKSDLKRGGAHPCIHYGELFTAYGAVIENIISTTDLDLPVKSEAGDVLMPTSDVTPAGLAKASAIMRTGVGLGGDVLIIRPNTTKVDPRFLAYAIRHDADQVLAIVRGSTVYHLYASDMRHFEFPLLPLDAQAAAADALSDSDGLIQAVERMILKKQLIKQGLMQQLLTGRTRLPSFTTDWSKSTIGSLSRVVGGGTPSTRVSSYWNGKIPWFTPAEIVSDGSGLVSMSQRSITQEGLTSSGATLLPRGTVLVTSRASIGNCAVAAVPVATNQGFASLIPADLRSTWFLYYWVQQNRSELLSRAAGSTFLEISASKVANIPLAHPSLDEQERIGETLRDSDAELDALKRWLTKVRNVKIAMMQQLLTGRSRLPEREASP